MRREMLGNGSMILKSQLVLNFFCPSNNKNTATNQNAKACQTGLKHVGKQK